MSLLIDVLDLGLKVIELFGLRKLTIVLDASVSDLAVLRDDDEFRRERTPTSQDNRPGWELLDGMSADGRANRLMETRWRPPWASDKTVPMHTLVVDFFHNDRGAKCLVSMAMVKATGEDVT